MPVKPTKAQPSVNRPKPASSGSATTPEVTAQPLKKQAQPGVFFGLSFDGQNKVMHSAAIPKKDKPHSVAKTLVIAMRLHKYF